MSFSSPRNILIKKHLDFKVFYCALILFAIKNLTMPSLSQFTTFYHEHLHCCTVDTEDKNLSKRLIANFTVILTVFYFLFSQKPEWPIQLQLVVRPYRLWAENIFIFLNKHEYFNRNITLTRRTNLHPGSEWSIFHILTGKDINDVIFRFSQMLVQSQFIYIIKKKITQ